LHIWVSYLILILLAVVIYLRKNALAKLFSNLKYELDEFVDEVSKYNWLKWSLIGIFTVAIRYIFVGLNYTFIPYPTAWDANHAYMFTPRIYGIYD
jgi:hypothetical protein